MLVPEPPNATLSCEGANATGAGATSVANATAANCSLEVTRLARGGANGSLGAGLGDGGGANGSNGSNASSPPLCAHSGPRRMWLADQATPSPKPGRGGGGGGGGGGAEEEEELAAALRSMAASSRVKGGGGRAAAPPPPPPPTRANATRCIRQRYVRGGVSWLVDVSGWAKSGAVLGSHFGKLLDPNPPPDPNQPPNPNQPPEP